VTDYKLPEPAGKIAYQTRPYEPEWISSADAYEAAQMQQAYQAGRDSMKAEAVKAVHNCLKDYVFTAEMAGHAGRNLQLAENAIKELK